MSINNNITNDFGILLYEVSQAVIPDLAVLGCYCGDYYKEYFSKMKKLIKYRFNTNIECFSISNTIYDGIESQGKSEMEHISVSSEYVDNQIQTFKYYGEKIFNVLNLKDSKKMAEYIIDMLANYGQSECV